MSSRKWIARWLPLAALAALAIVAVALGLGRYLTLDALREHRQVLQAFVRDNAAAAAFSYVGAYIVVVALSLPGGAAMTVTGGFLFGVALGGPLAVVGATAGATALFLAARSVFGDMLRRRAGPFLRKMENGFRENAFNYLLFLRLVPVFPFWAVNLAPALLGVEFVPFFGATAIGIIPVTFIYAAFGAGLGRIFDTGGDIRLGDVFSPTLIGALVGLGLLALLPIALRKWKESP
ncbi:MAG: TVP38/TMEM64 family protein [Methylocystis sp.]|nr:TVP38/TMEM64 family protein [Methylocystis sp.]